MEGITHGPRNYNSWTFLDSAKRGMTRNDLPPLYLIEKKQFVMRSDEEKSR
jgi:hypothetical protein